MSESTGHIFTKRFWNRGRIVWGFIIGLCTIIPVTCGSFYTLSRWADEQIISPYVKCKADSTCIKITDPLKEDIKTMITDVKFTRKCLEEITPAPIKDKVKSQMFVDSLLDNKYHTR